METINLEYGGKSYTIEVKVLKYGPKLVIFAVPENGWFGTIVLGEA